MTDPDTPRPRKVPRWLAMLETQAIHHPLPPAEYARAVLDETVRAANLAARPAAPLLQTDRAVNENDVL